MADSAVALARAALASEPPDVERAQRLFARARALAPDDALVATAARDCDTVADALRAASAGDGALTRLLGVAVGASAAELRAAARKLALRLHPDKNVSPCAAHAFAAMRGAVDRLVQRKSGTTCWPADGDRWRARAEDASPLEALCASCAHTVSLPARAADAGELGAIAAWRCGRCGAKGSAPIADVLSGAQRTRAQAEVERVRRVEAQARHAAEEADEARLRALAREALLRSEAAARRRSTAAPPAAPPAQPACAGATPLRARTPCEPANRPASSAVHVAVCRDVRGRAAERPAHDDAPPESRDPQSRDPQSRVGGRPAEAEARAPEPPPISATSNVHIAALFDAVDAISRSIGFGTWQAQPPSLAPARPAHAVHACATAHAARRAKLLTPARRTSRAGARPPLTGCKRAFGQDAKSASPAPRKRPCARLPDWPARLPDWAARFPSAGAARAELHSGSPLPTACGTDAARASAREGAREVRFRASSWPRPRAGSCAHSVLVDAAVRAAAADGRASDEGRAGQSSPSRRAAPHIAHASFGGGRGTVGAIASVVDLTSSPNSRMGRLASMAPR